MTRSKREVQRAVYLTESGDPSLWPKVVELYHKDEGWISIICQHLYFWDDHFDLINPFLKECLSSSNRDVVEEVFTLCCRRYPSMRDDILAVLKNQSMMASFQKDGLDYELIQSVACLFGYFKDEYGFGDPSTPIEERLRIYEEIRLKLKSEYSIDFELSEKALHFLKDEYTKEEPQIDHELLRIKYLAEMARMAGDWEQVAWLYGSLNDNSLTNAEAKRLAYARKQLGSENKIGK